MRTYAIGDIHGQADLLEEAHRLIAADRAQMRDDESPIVHLGDLEDRGPDSARVIAQLLEGVAAGKPWVVLKGNHDRMFTGFLADPFHHDPGLRLGIEWLNPRLGGPTTLASYGVEVEGREPPEIRDEALIRVPEAHVAFLAGLPTLFQRGELAFVHAGIRPGVALGDQTEDDLVWIRTPFLEDTRDYGPLIVHGHTALDEARHHGNRVNLDSGAGYGRPLTVAVFEGRDVWRLTPEGRIPLLPDP